MTHRSPLFAAAAGLALITAAQAQTLTLAAQGQSDYQIVLPDFCADAVLSNRLERAAVLMQAAFAANGCPIPVVTEGARNPGRPGIYLGDTAKARASGIVTSELAEWGYVLKTVSRDVIIAGRDEVIPQRRSEALRGAIPNLVYARTIEGAGHNGIYGHPGFPEAMQDALAAVTKH